jgi:large conductance mechanosensitive channel
MWKEFKEFIQRGNVLDLAVGIVIGAAFGKIVSDFVDLILMPPIGLLLGRIDFSSLYFALNGQKYASLVAAKAAGAPVIGYGQFINDLINFLIIAFVIFLIVRWFNRLKKPAAAQDAPSTKECPYCASTISIKATRCPECTSQL